MKPLHIFYEEPNPDRWIKFDRYPRKLIRRLFRGPEPIGGVKRWFVNLIHGLDKLGYPYIINNYKKLSKNPCVWALVIGKPHVIEKIPNHINIIYGPGIGSHPLEDNLFEKNNNIKHILISSKWFKEMYDRDLPTPVPTSIWASGIDTNLWKPDQPKLLKGAILIYDKIRWDWDLYNEELLKPINKKLEKEGITIYYIKYGNYKEEQFRNLLSLVDGMIFLCEHETQGFAYLQTLSCDIPILAWDRGGAWKDPAMYPHKVIFQNVSSVPYWNQDCGEKFKDFNEFESIFILYWERVCNFEYSPRKYIIENFKLEDRAQAYINLVNDITSHRATSLD
ncbi:glycosyltransferase [Daejeonella oryzae]|uniref:glycosyltransferase n=1 Tax=Daejeonella oryzae TaxID=1122943 RepID=UPI000411C4DF|nr:glycosyltransferase [Daejeonella oryzae]